MIGKNTDRDGRALQHAAPESSRQEIYKQYLENPSAFNPSTEDIMCETQLLTLGNWEMLDFQIDQKQWREDQKSLSTYWRPFQPKKDIMNDRESILLYGMEGDTPTEPSGLSQYKNRFGYKPKETEFKYPTIARDKLRCCSDVFDWFGEMGRSFVIRLNAGGFYPRHRDSFMINRDTVRLIAFLNDSREYLEWEVDNTVMSFVPGRVYYVNTARVHRLSAWRKECDMVVMNVPKTWENVVKLMSRLTY